MRKRYLMFKRTDWEAFKDKVNEKDAIAKKQQEQSQYVKDMIEASENLKRDWDDTYEKLIARQEEEREKRRLAENVSRMNFYKQYLEQKRIEREKMLAQAEEFNFRQRDEPKTLLSSLMCSETLRQIEVQRKFNEMIRQEKREEELQNSRDVKAHVEEWKKIEADRYKRRREKNIQVAGYIRKQHEDRQREKLEAKMEEVAMEKEDVINAAREMEELRQHDIKTKKKYIEFVRNQGRMTMEMAAKRKHENKVLNEMEDKMIDVYLSVTCKINNITKARLKYVADEKERFMELTRSRFPRREAILWAKEEKSMQKAQEEYERKEVETINNKKAKKDAAAEEKRRLHVEWQKKEAEQQENDDAVRKWEIANRLKNDELTKEFKEREILLKAKKMKEYTEFLNQQVRDLEKKKKEEKEEIYDFYHTQRLNSLKNINDKFVTYSANLIEECKQAGRPTRPLEKVVVDYKAKYMAPPRRYPSRYLTTGPQKEKPKK